MNLLKSLQQAQTRRAEQPVPGAAANLQKLLAAKSGKAGAITGPASSNIQERQVLADANAAATQQQQAAQSAVANQQQQADQVTQQATQQQQQLASRQQDAAQKFEQGVSAIENKLDRLGKDIDSKEGQQALQSAIAARRLSDKQYMTELGREGQIRRLEDGQNFQLEAGKAAFDTLVNVFNDDLAFERMLTMDQREFDREAAQMSEDTANAILSSEMEAANKQAQYASYGNVANAFNTSATKEYTTEDAAGAETTASFYTRLGRSKDLTSAPVTQKQSPTAGITDLPKIPGNLS